MADYKYNKLDKEYELSIAGFWNALVKKDIFNWLRAYIQEPFQPRLGYGYSEMQKRFRSVKALIAIGLFWSIVLTLPFVIGIVGLILKALH